jgi:hypothetical protein
MVYFKAMVAKDSIDKNQKWKQLLENNKILEKSIKSIDRLIHTSSGRNNVKNQLF